MRALNKQTILFMTATIDTSPDMRNNARNDPAVRRADYQAALRGYLGLPAGVPDRLLICENSGADLASLRQIAETENPHGRPVDFISYQSKVPPAAGKSHAELEILAHAHATVLHAQPDAMIWKITGRLFVRNLPAMIASCPDGAGLYCDTRSVRAFGNRVWTNHWVDTRLIAYTPDYFATYLLPIRSQGRMRKNAIEAATFDALQPAFGKDKGLVPRFRCQPVFAGVCGGSNDDYEGARYRAKTYVRALARRVTPWIWI